jgi:hypothetical protein
VVFKYLVTIVGRPETMTDAKQEKMEAFREAAKAWLEKMETNQEDLETNQEKTEDVARYYNWTPT